MSVTLIAVGIDNYFISSEPMIESVRIHEPKARIILVDNKADVPYPREKGVEIRRLGTRVCMSTAMNQGAAGVRSDWLIFSNNDIICTAPFIQMVNGLNKGAIYGVDLLNWWGRSWLDGWVMAIPRRIWEQVGLFDDNFLYAGFEDADYCFRVRQAGFGVEAVNLPFIHTELHSRFSMPGYMEQREANIKYLAKKWDMTI